MGQWSHSSTLIGQSAISAGVIDNIILLGTCDHNHEPSDQSCMHGLWLTAPCKQGDVMNGRMFWQPETMLCRVWCLLDKKQYD
jgi:hypothetical protein